MPIFDIIASIFMTLFLLSQLINIQDILNRLSDEELKCFYEAFKEFDYNNDGHINTKELSKLVRENTIKTDQEDFSMYCSN